MLSEISLCSDCLLREECTKPVPPTIGEFNMSIVGEGPGRNEDEQGEGFVGDAGDVLFTCKGSLKEYGLGRELFHITNVCKCWPKLTKTPKAAHVKACSKFLDMELEAVKPFIIFALGNTAVKYFRGEDKGISNLNATTTWSDKYKCWICWGLHPAATLYRPEAADDFRKAVANFAEKIAVLGFGS